MTDDIASRVAALEALIGTEADVEAQRKALRDLAAFVVSEAQARTEATMRVDALVQTLRLVPSLFEKELGKIQAEGRVQSMHEVSEKILASFDR